MASHDQVKRNEHDVNSAWGQFRDLIHLRLPTYASFVDTARTLTKVRKRYR